MEQQTQIAMDYAQMSEQDLRKLIAEATAELARRSGPARVAVSFGPYNARRYGRPWIARVSSWPVGGKPELQWGSYVGDDAGGEAEILARPGDILRAGQKDNRGGKTDNDWYVVEDNSIVRSITPEEARQLFSEVR